MDRIYYKYSDYLKETYGCRVYKLPVNLDLTCPNRDGRKGYGGCTYCGSKGTGFENLPKEIDVKKQIEINMKKIGELYKAERFIAYYQNYTNTYMPLDDFRKYISEGITDKIVGISVSTRPDCISEGYLNILREVSKSNGVDITIELGLQTANYHTLKNINRGHGIAEYINAVLKIKEYGFRICTHVILNLPGDTAEDNIETAKIISVLNTNQVKLHGLYIVKDSEMGRQYKNGEIDLIGAEEYKERVISFLTYLAPDIAIERLIGRAPEGDAYFANWGMSWWKIRDDIDRIMTENDIYQGMNYNYTSFDY